MDTSAPVQQTKICTKCGATKSFSGFHKSTTSKDGLRSRCKACYADYQRERYQSDPGRRAYHRTYQSQRRQSDPDYREYLRVYTRERRRSDPDFRVSLQMRRMVHRVLLAAGHRKTTPTQEALGYSAKELRAHIEAQFKPGMSWEDRSAWHIDHVKPVSAFIAKGITDPKIINALSNLSPLWARDNITKGARYQ